MTDASRRDFLTHHTFTLGQALLALAAWSPAAAQGSFRGSCKLVPVMSTRTPPPWPPGSRQANAQGTVTLEVTIARNGHATRTRIVKSSGFPSLDEASASHVLRNYLWQPLNCASARTTIRVVWDPAGLCAITKSCEPRTE
jgi:TonB family protein